MRYIISLGGSVICPSLINRGFLKRFRRFILKRVKKGERFLIIVGGGRIARYYQITARKEGVKNSKDLDWLGIYTTWLNAYFLKSLFKRYSQKELIVDPLNDKLDLRKRIIVGGGWKPGWSTDYVCVLLAKRLKVKMIINLSDITFIYNKDPKQFKSAKPFKRLSWSAYKKIAVKLWKPGLNSPFDSKATNLAQKLNLRVVFLKGDDLKNFKLFLDGNNFKGTVIED